MSSQCEDCLRLKKRIEEQALAILDANNLVAQITLDKTALERQLKDERHKTALLTSKCKRYRQGRGR